MACIIHAATMRIVPADSDGVRASMSRRITADETLDLIKVVLVGDSGVGKTALMLRFVRDQFVTSTRATVGMDFSTRQLAVDTMQGLETSIVQQLTVQVWDTAGQEQFRSLAATYYRRAGGVLIVYDANNRQSFENIPGWIKDVDANAEDVVKMVVASKAEGSTEVSSAEGETLAAKHGCLFFSVSSKEGFGVVPAFKALAERVLQDQETKELRANAVKESISLADDPKPKAAARNCCA